MPREQSLDAASRLYRDALDVQLDEVLRTLIVSKLSRVLAVTDPSAVKALESELRPVRDFTSAEIDKLEGSTTGTRRKDEGSRKRPIAEGTAKVGTASFLVADLCSVHKDLHSISSWLQESVVHIRIEC